MLRIIRIAFCILLLLAAAASALLPRLGAIRLPSRYVTREDFDR